MNKTFLNKMLPHRMTSLGNSMLMGTSLRSFGASNAYSVKSKFETAYNAKLEQSAKFKVKT